MRRAVYVLAVAGLISGVAAVSVLMTRWRRQNRVIDTKLDAELLPGEE